MLRPRQAAEVARTSNATGGLLAPGFISARLSQMVRNLKQDPEWGAGTADVNSTSFEFQQKG